MVLYYKFARAQLTSKGWVGSKAGGQCGVIILICTCTSIMWLVQCKCIGEVEGVGGEVEGVRGEQWWRSVRYQHISICTCAGNIGRVLRISLYVHNHS